MTEWARFGGPFSLGEEEINRPAKKREIVAVKVDEGLVRAIDALADRQFRSRSDIIRQGVLKELEANGICAVSALSSPAPSRPASFPLFADPRTKFLLTSNRDEHGHQEQPKTYSADREGVMEAAQIPSLSVRPNATSPMPDLEVPDSRPASGRTKEPVSYLNGRKKERPSGKPSPSSGKSRKLIRSKRRMRLNSLPPKRIWTMLLIRKLTDATSPVSAEDYQQALDLGGKRLEAKLYEAQVQNANAVLDSRLSNAGGEQHVRDSPTAIARRVSSKGSACKATEDLQRVLQDPQLAPQAAQFIAEANQLLLPHAHEAQRQQAAWTEANEHWSQFQDADFERRVAQRPSRAQRAKPVTRPRRAPWTCCARRDCPTSR